MQISLLWFFKTITKIWLMQFYGLFILLLRISIRREPSVVSWARIFMFNIFLLEQSLLM